MRSRQLGDANGNEAVATSKYVPSSRYASNTGTTWQVTPLTNVFIPAGQYHLVQFAGGANGAPLPTPDTTGTILMSATAGKVALVNTTTALNGNGCPLAVSVVDFIGYGTSADCREGGVTTASNAPAPSATAADLRNANGCTDTNNNNADFTAGTPSPRNSASPANPCTTITVTNVTSSVPDTTFTTGDVIDIIITFSGQVNVTGSPTLLLETGAIDRPATYVSGAGTNTLLFSYTVYTWLVIVAVMFSAISAYFYHRIVMLMYMREPNEAVQLNSSPGIGLSLGVTATAVIIIGILPSQLMAFARLAAAAF